MTNIPQSAYDFAQVLKAVFDEANASLRVQISGLTLDISDASDSIKIGDGTGKYATITTVGGKNGIDANIIGGVVSGEFTTSGLSKGLKTAEITITDVATKVPTTPLTDRNGISIRVWNPLDSSAIVYFGDSSVTESNGYPKYNDEEIMLDIKDDSPVELYAICASGKSAKLRIIELA